MVEQTPTPIIIDNVRIIDGTGRQPIEKGVIVIEGSIIKDVGSRGSVEQPDNAEIIDGKKMTVMPGLIDAHMHLTGLRTGDFVKEPLITPLGVFFARGVVDAKALLEAGFTTIRDAGSLIALHLKYAIEEGTVQGPRILAAGYVLSQTFGHGDEHYLPIEWVDARTTKKLTPLVSLICDGIEECRKAARHALREGADFIKICSTGGVLSQKDRPEYVQFTVEETKAIVEEAEHVGTYVASHAQGARGIKNALLAGVRTIEHGIFIDEEGIELVLEREAVIVPTFSIVKRILEKGGEIGIPEWGLKKAEEVNKDHISNIRKAAKAGVKIATGTDFVGGPVFRHGDNSLELQLLVEYLGFTPLEAIKSATLIAADAVGLEDKIGSLEKGKLADLIIVKGNPDSDISVLRNPGNIVLVMKEGKIFKNTLQQI